MAKTETYWKAVNRKNEALAEVRRISAELAQIRERLFDAEREFVNHCDEVGDAWTALTDEEKEEVRNTNTWGNA